MGNVFTSSGIYFGVAYQMCAGCWISDQHGTFEYERDGECVSCGDTDTAVSTFQQSCYFDAESIYIFRMGDSYSRNWIAATVQGARIDPKDSAAMTVYVRELDGRERSLYVDHATAIYRASYGTPTRVLTPTTRV